MQEIGLKVSILTAGRDPEYALLLLSALASKGIKVDFIGSDRMKDAEILQQKSVSFYNFYKIRKTQFPLIKKVMLILIAYWRLIKYAIRTDSKIFHVLWLNKFTYFDRVFLFSYFKILGKKLIFTAHNINAGERDGNNSILNKLTLKIMYNIVDHIFVHTKRMKSQLMDQFFIRENKITVISFGINNYFPNTSLSRIEARQKLDIENNEKIFLFFGRIVPYKGIEFLLLAIKILKERLSKFKLVIAGRKEKQAISYWYMLENIINENSLRNYIMQKIEFIPDQDIEIYFKAADILILPYKYIFQSGPLFLAYNYGLPVLATDTGSFREDIVEGKTGYICQTENPEDLAEKIMQYYNSDLYKNLESSRIYIRNYAIENYSWDIKGDKTCEVYKKFI